MRMLEPEEGDALTDWTLAPFGEAIAKRLGEL